MSGQTLDNCQHSTRRLSENQIFACPSIILHVGIYIYIRCSSPTTHLWRLRGQRRCSSYSFTTSALDGGEWSASRLCSALPPRKEPPVPIGQEAGWTKAVLDTEVSGKVPFASAGDRTPIPGRPVLRHCTDWATSAPRDIYIYIYRPIYLQKFRTIVTTCKGITAHLLWWRMLERGVYNLVVRCVQLSIGWFRDVVIACMNTVHVGHVWFMCLHPLFSASQASCVVFPLFRINPQHETD
jgi:hypothetical protein